MITTIVIIRTNAVGIDIPSINAKLISPAVTDSSYTSGTLISNPFAVILAELTVKFPKVYPSKPESKVLKTLVASYPSAIVITELTYTEPNIIDIMVISLGFPTKFPASF